MKKFLQIIASLICAMSLTGQNVYSAQNTDNNAAEPVVVNEPVEAQKPIEGNGGKGRQAQDAGKEQDRKSIAVKIKPMKKLKEMVQ